MSHQTLIPNELLSNRQKSQPTPVLEQFVRHLADMRKTRGKCDVSLRITPNYEG